MKIRHHPNWGSHLPLLMSVMSKTTGPVLEMGGGFYSTPFLHWYCFDKDRELVTLENNDDYYHHLKQYHSGKHSVIHVSSFDDYKIEKPWDVAFLDHAPEERRTVDVRRLSNFCEYIVMHDTEGNPKQKYNYESIWHLFKYRFDYTKIIPQTSVVSNFNKLDEIME